MHTKFYGWIKAFRIQFLVASILPVLLGTILAKLFTNQFNFFYFILTLIGVMFLHLGTNVLNDYFDYLNNTDNINTEYSPGFSGGSRVLQQGLLTLGEVLLGAIVLFCLSLIIGIYLAYNISWIVLLFGFAGIFFSFAYSFFKNSFFVGEILVGLFFGLLIPLGAYFVQTTKFSLEILIFSIPFILVLFLILWINEFVDYKADKLTGKKTMVVRIGRKKASVIYNLTVIIIFFYVINLGFLLNIYFFILFILALPLALKSMSQLYSFYDEPAKMKVCIPLTIAMYLFFSGVLLIGLLFYGGRLLLH
ncbi:prenyltransferase [bacterium]